MNLPQCQAALDEALKTPKISALISSINKHLEKQVEIGHGSTSLPIECHHCSEKGVEGTARAFLASPPPTVILCANRLHGSAEVKEALTHELIHAYDLVVRNMDITQGENLACSEIRAAREAECFLHDDSVIKKLCSDPFPIFTQNLCEKWKKRCVQVNATKATQAIFPQDGDCLVEKMMTSCFQDHLPFECENSPCSS